MLRLREVLIFPKYCISKSQTNAHFIISSHVSERAVNNEYEKNLTLKYTELIITNDYY